MPTVPRKKRRRKLAAGAAVVLGAAMAPEAAAAVITVNSTADTVGVDGDCTLREAVANANANDGGQVDCTAGTGLDTIDFAALTFPATIVLGGTSLSITDPLIIDGPGQTDLTIDGNDASRIFTIEDGDSSTAINVAIDDLTLIEGNAATESITGGGAIFSAENLTLTNVTISGSESDAGGAVLHQGGVPAATLTVVDSTFTGNSASYGGAIFAGVGDVDISGSTFTLNTVDCCGGAISSYVGGFTLTNSSVTDNTAFTAGGIALYYSDGVVITNTTISGNEALGNVGGLYIYGAFGSVTIEDSIISGNEAAANVGGLHISDSPETDVTILDTEISGNIAGVSTGGLYLYDTGAVTIERMKLINNTAASYQGGGALWDVQATIVESQISGNQAPTVGGLYVAYGSYLYLVNSTIANNTATTGSVGGLGINSSYAFIDVSTISGNSAPAGAAGNIFLYGAQFYMSNSIVADGTAVAGPDLVTASSNAFINFSLIENAAGATFTGANNLTGIDPQLGPLQNNGGPTETLMPALTSPVIDAGDPEFVAPPNDQRGFPRPIGIVDMGAVEVNAGTLSLSATAYPAAEGVPFVTITVNRTGGSDGAVSVDYATASGSATAGADFTTTGGTLNWASGDAEPKTFNIPIADDLIFEGSEQFTVSLSNVAGATLGTSSATVTIADNDTQPTISIDNPSVTETNGFLTFNVTLSNPSAQTITADFTTSGGTAEVTFDYTPVNGTVTFNPGVTSQPIAVTIFEDSVDEADETVEVTLSNAVNATFLDNAGEGTILDDEATPTISIDDTSAIEGNAGNTPATFNVTLSGPSEQTITVDFATAAVSATSGDDFLPNSGTVTFDPLETAQPVVVQVVGDTTDETNEIFNVVLSNPSAAATILDGTGAATIIDDDGAPSITISDVSLAEGNAGTTNFTFTVTLTPASAQTVTVDFATAGVSATSGDDFLPTSGTLTFIPGDTSETITVTVTGDTAVEPDETFTVSLSNATLATLGDGTGTGTILNDDAAADLSITKTAGAGPYVQGQTTTFTIAVSNAGPGSATNVTVTDILPAGTSFVSATPSAGSCSGTTTVTCNVGTLANGGSATIALTVQLNNAGAVTNTATAGSDLPDPTPAAGAATITVQPATGQAIPTLSEWMLVALASALAAIAALKVKR